MTPMNLKNKLNAQDYISRNKFIELAEIEEGKFKLKIKTKITLSARYFI